MKYEICDVLSTGYGWISPEGVCIQVDQPSDILPALVQECEWVRPFYNTRTTRDNKFYYDLSNFIYSKGYIRVSKNKNVLAVESNDIDIITEKSQLIQSICNAGHHRGSKLDVKMFIVSPISSAGHDDPERFKYFPRK